VVVVAEWPPQMLYVPEVVVLGVEEAGLLRIVYSCFRVVVVLVEVVAAHLAQMLSQVLRVTVVVVVVLGLPVELVEKAVMVL
jgi:hypothetical protein